jgi:hypothetical protein
LGRFQNEALIPCFEGAKIKEIKSLYKLFIPVC